MKSLPKREQFNSAFFTLTIRPSTIGGMSVLRPKRLAQGHWPHIDNEKPHKPALSFQTTKEARFSRLPQLTHSHDLAPCDFFLSGYLKKEQEGRNSSQKPSDLCGETNFRSDPDSNAFRRI
jgi:hypothetical protein